MSDNTDNTDNTDKASIPGRSEVREDGTIIEPIPSYIRDYIRPGFGCDFSRIDKLTVEIKNRRIKSDAEIKMYAANYRIMRILCDAAERKAEKESCRPGCYGAKQKFEETLDNMFSCDFKSDNEEDEEDSENSEDGKDCINVVVEKPNIEKEDLDADRVTDSGEIDASGNKIHVYSFALRPQGSVSQKDQIAKLHKPFKKNKKPFKKK
jgi:hypothetical protein